MVVIKSINKYFYIISWVFSSIMELFIKMYGNFNRANQPIDSLGVNTLIENVGLFIRSLWFIDIKRNSISAHLRMIEIDDNHCLDIRPREEGRLQETSNLDFLPSVFSLSIKSKLMGTHNLLLNNLQRLCLFFWINLTIICTNSFTILFSWL